jgi:hypothetical protein
VHRHDRRHAQFREFDGGALLHSPHVDSPGPRHRDLRSIDILNGFLGPVLPEYKGWQAVRKVSVCSPTYNTGKDRLLRAWRSLQRQTCAGWDG